MPVSVVCESTANVNAALRESLSSSVGYGKDKMKMDMSVDDDDDDCLQDKLVASAKRILLETIEYEEVEDYNQAVLQNFKKKYILLNPDSEDENENCDSPGKDSEITCAGNGSNSSSIIIGGNVNGFGTETNGSNSKQRSNANELPQSKYILYPRENVRIGWKNPYRKWQVGVGMMNVGNTCYLNSTLQALFHVPSMANWLLSDSQHLDRCDSVDAGCIICAMAKTLQAAQSNQSAIRPYFVYSKLKSICKHLVMGRQEDAHEFLRYLVEAMEKAYLSRFRNYKELDQFSKETTPLNQILGGYLKSAVRCLNCRHVSVTFQHFQDLLLDIRKADTVEEALDGYFSLERLEDMGYKCEACKKKVSATKQFSLERAPIALCIQLKRFSMLGTKINKQITIKPRLDLTKFASRKNMGEQLTYKLVAMVTHLGASQHCGHYTAIGLTESGTYYNYDDSYVRPISLQNVCNTNAYIIFYEMDTVPARHNVTSTQISGEASESKENYQKINGSANTTPNHFNGSSTPQRIIGPQLPMSGISTSPFNTYNNNNNTKSNSLANGSKLTSSKCSNGSPASANNSIKIIFKNNNNTSSLKPSNDRSPNSSSLSSSSKMQNGLQSATGKLQNSTFLNDNESSFNDGDAAVSSSTTQKKQTSIENSNSKQTLPSMPKLFEHSQLLSHDALPSPQTFMNTSQKSLVPYESASDDDDDEQTPGRITSATSTSMDSLKNARKRINSSSEESDGGKSKMQKPIPTTNVNNSQSKDRVKTDAIDEIFAVHKRSHNNNNKRNNDDSNSKSHRSSTTPAKKSLFNNQRLVVPQADDAAESENIESEGFYLRINKKRSQSMRSHSTPPSPPVIKTKTGLWQVTPLQPVTPPSSRTWTPEEDKTPPSSYKNPRNPFAVNSAKNELFSKHPKQKSESGTSSQTSSARSNGYHASAVNDSVVSELLKQTHRPYNTPILNWNGSESSLHKEIKEEERQQRRRDWEEEEENEMDRGRQKKVKSHKETHSSAPGYNPFQEQDNQRRWKHGGGGGGAPQRSYCGAQFRRSHFQRNNGGHGGGGGGGAFKRFNYKYKRSQHRGGNHYNGHNRRAS